MPEKQEPWFYRSGDVRVAEHEHLFGWDYVLSVKVHDEWFPRGIITKRTRALQWERRFAVEWCALTDAGDFPGAVLASQALASEPPLVV